MTSIKDSQTLTPKEKTIYKGFANAVFEGFYGKNFEEIIAEKDQRIAEMDQRIVEMDQRIVEKDEIIAEKDQQIVEQNHQLIMNLLKKEIFSIREIAELIGVSQYKVRKIKKELEASKE